MSTQPLRDAGTLPADPAAGNATRGILLAFVSFAAFAFSDASVKLVEGDLPPIESAFFGALFGVLVLPFLMRGGGRWSDVFATGNRPLWLLRFFAYPIGVIGSVTAFTHLSMAEAFVLIFLQPAFVTLMSVLFLKERVGIRSWSAVAIGFIGVLIVLRPGFRELSIGHLGALFAGLGGGVSILVFRLAGPYENKMSLFGAGLFGALTVCGVAMIPMFEIPTAGEWLFLAGYGLLAALGNILLMYAALHAPAAYISPTQYSQMLWAILLGYLVFGDHLDLPVLIGIVFIMGSGMLTLDRGSRRGAPLPARDETAPAGDGRRREGDS